MTLSDKLRLLVKDRGISASRVARDIRGSLAGPNSRATILRWFSGDVKTLEPQALQVLADYFRVSVAYLAAEEATRPQDAGVVLRPGESEVLAVMRALNIDSATAIRRLTQAPEAIIVQDADGEDADVSGRKLRKAR